ncbi:hypothetical protein [Helicobacter pylori]|nr:hypothetical protein [Helicobacter pylori]
MKETRFKNPKISQDQLSTRSKNNTKNQTNIKIKQALKPNKSNKNKEDSK